ncbi:hypothetical protein [Rhodoferax saidenbachensis]|nr:hypothetical protein [Rhodoferax saidenbachensis]
MRQPLKLPIVYIHEDLLLAHIYLVLLNVQFAAVMVSKRSFCGVAILLTTAAALMPALKKLTHSP